MTKLRLILFDDCDRACRGCCNKDWNLPGLPIVDSFVEYDEIMLTGGEPLLDPSLVLKTITDVRHQSRAKIFVYTAKLDDVIKALAVLAWADGLTVTLHTQKDVVNFLHFDKALSNLRWSKSLRLNVFKGVILPDVDITDWQVKNGITWIKDCPLPTNEVMMRLPQTEKKGQSQ